ncbi:MAG: DUF4189 domain-containing protein [Nitrospirae bacterium]|nr:DUF4189 domain-containing protein [Nitrospirota bacterium]
MKRLVYLLVVALIAGVCYSEKAFAIGAIAFSDPDEIYGFCLNEKDKTSAKICAMTQCKDAGGEACKFMVWFDGCGAVALNKKYYGIGYGTSPSKAEAMALKQCGSGCEIAISKCEN